MVRPSNVTVAAALAIVVSAGLTFPFFLTKGKTVDTSKPFVGQAVVRGPYTNTGSKDIGPDPKQYTKSAAFRVKPFRSSRACSVKQKRRSEALPWLCQRNPDSLQGSLNAAKKAAASILAALTLLLGSEISPAEAVLNSPNAGIARTVDVALRRSIPASNADVRNMQRALEDIAFKLRIPQRKPWQQMTEDVIKATSIVNNEAQVMVGVPSGQEARASQLRDEIRAGLIRVNAAIDAKDADKVSIRTNDTLESVAQLELIQAPGLAFSIPRDLRSLPRLTGRAIVEFTIARNGNQGFVGPEGGGGKPEAQIRVAVDGYSAPITAGNFISNILSGAYEGSRLAIGGETVSVTSEKLEGKTLPMEMLPLGEFDPVYRSQLDVQHGELPVLPLSIYGAVAMAHPGADIPDGYAAGNEFFLYKFDRASSGLAGLSFEEGLFPVFGYVTNGLEYLQQLNQGDTIVQAKLVSGKDRLVLPEGQAPSPASAEDKALES